MGKRNDLYRASVEKLRKRLSKELPILRENLDVLVRDRNNGNYTILSNVIHNIAIILNSEVHSFFEPLLRLWAGISSEADEVVLSERKRICDEILSELIRQEQVLYNAQIDEARKERKRIKKENNGVSESDMQRVPSMAELEESFEHIEYDVSPQFVRFWYFTIIGMIELSKEQMLVLQEIYNLCVVILEREIPKREEALKKCDIILASV